MLKSHSIVASVVAIHWIASPAAADWQYTKWGMTPDQVQVAGGGNLGAPLSSEACQNCSPIPLLAGEYVTDQFQFHALFQFKNGQSLSLIDLKMPDAGGRCRALYDSLATRYGAPVFQRGSFVTLRTTRWLDPAGGNTVFFINSAGVTGDCTIQYSPLDSSKGL